MKKINIGIIGTGFIGPAHIEALRRINFVEVVALADIDSETAKKKAFELFIPSYYGDYKEMLLREDIDAVHICTPNFLHYEMAKAVLNAGKHAICEKPLALSAKEAEELVELADRKKLLNAVNFNLRFYPLVQQAKSIVASGKLGRVFAINGSYQQDWLLYQTDYNWRVDPQRSGKSRAVADIGSHWLDVAQYIVGEKITGVCADFATFHKVRKKSLNSLSTYSASSKASSEYEEIQILTEDYASMLLEFDGKIRGSVTVNQAAAGRKNRLYFEICGSDKSLSWSSERPNELWLGNRNAFNEVSIKDPLTSDEHTRNFISYPGGHNEGFPDTIKQFFLAFYGHLAEGNASGQNLLYPTFETGLEEMVLIDRIYESAKKRSWVHII